MDTLDTLRELAARAEVLASLTSDPKAIKAAESVMELLRKNERGTNGTRRTA